MTVEQERKCTYCGAIIVYEPYVEAIGGKEYAFHAKPCADAFKQRKCAYCGGLIAYEPYVEAIGGKEYAFHAKSCADAFRQKLAE